MKTKLSKRHIQRLRDDSSVEVKKIDAASIEPDKNINALEPVPVPKAKSKAVVEVLTGEHPSPDEKKRWKFTLHRNFDSLIDHIIAEEL